MSSPSRGRILLVEDDEDSRQFMSVALSVRGYVVDEASGADQALAMLRASRYDLVLTDYDMPGKTGAAMLKEADAAGLLQDTPALVVTAHPEPVGVEGLDLIRKPLDIDKFLLQVAKILEPGRVASPEPRVAAPLPLASVEPAPEAAPEPLVEFALYISRVSPPSLRARRNMDALLAGFNRKQVHVEVCDLALNPTKADRDRVIFTPTLVKRRPGPSTWVLGDLSDTTMVVDLLTMYGVERVG
jgi:CheY-like chemotaxis protein